MTILSTITFIIVVIMLSITALSSLYYTLKTYYSPNARYQRGYERSIKDIASGTSPYLLLKKLGNISWYNAYDIGRRGACLSIIKQREERLKSECMNILVANRSGINPK